MCTSHCTYTIPRIRSSGHKLQSLSHALVGQNRPLRMSMNVGVRYRPETVRVFGKASRPEERFGNWMICTVTVP
jgi:hypothetical protein